MDSLICWNLVDLITSWSMLTSIRIDIIGLQVCKAGGNDQIESIHLDQDLLKHSNNQLIKS